MSDKFNFGEAMKAVEGKFKTLGAEITSRKEKVAELQREIAGLTEEQIRLQGEYRALDQLKKDAEGGSVPAETVN